MMESASDDEFFDAEEDFSPKKSVKSPLKQEIVADPPQPTQQLDSVDDHPPVNHTEDDKGIEVKNKTVDINVPCEDDIISKDAEITRLQQFSLVDTLEIKDNNDLNNLDKDIITNTIPDKLDHVVDSIHDDQDGENSLLEPQTPTPPVTQTDDESSLTPVPTELSKSGDIEIQTQTGAAPLKHTGPTKPAQPQLTAQVKQSGPPKPPPPQSAGPPKPPPPQSAWPPKPQSGGPAKPPPPKEMINQPDEIHTEESTVPPQKPGAPEIPPQPVAPPRKKRQQKKVETGDLSTGRPSRPPPPRPPPPVKVVTLTDPPPVPCIKVSSSTTEMNQVLESGNSLEVVYNDDQMARRSGGILSPKTGSPTTTAKPNLTTPLTDAEILEQVIIKNLDTGETLPLSLAEEKLPKCTNPLALHILRLATEEEEEGMEEIDVGHDMDDGHMSDTSTTLSIKVGEGKRKKLRKFLGKTVQKIKSVADEVTGQGRPNDSSSEDEDQHDVHEGYIKFKNHRAIKDRLQFRKIKLLQDLSGDHIGAVWSMKFSLCGKLLATAGQDNIVRVWVLKEYAVHFEEMRLKYSKASGRSSPTGSMTSHTSTASADDDPVVQDLLLANADDDSNDGPFKKSPFVAYHGHTSDVLDLSWSKNFFLLSSSMDKTVRLWHISRNECLCCFQHVDFVTAICFHPRDDRYFLSGSLDGKIRLWNIPEKKVALWNEIDGSGTSLITAANFCQDGKLAVVGTYDGRCIFYDTERLKYHTQVTVRSSRGKNARGRKISGIEPMPNEPKVLITSNDSRIRLYDLKDHSLYCKYKGLQNESSQIRASFSHDGKLVLCGSEDKFVHIWRTNHEVPNARKDRNEYYESFSAHDAVVTAAIFAPFPNVIMEKSNGNKGTSSLQPPETAPKSSTAASSATAQENSTRFEVLVAADWQGGVKFYINR